MASFIKGNEHLWELIGITSFPSRSTLQRAMNGLSKEYLEELNRMVVEPYGKKGLYWLSVPQAFHPRRIRDGMI